MHSLNADFNTTRINDMRSTAARRRRTFGRRTKSGNAPPGPALTLRLLNLGSGDLEALERVAGRDSRPAPAGEVLGAELDGRLVAALSLSTGESVADPFEPTAAARNMLETRAAQLRERKIVTPRVIDALPARP